MVAREMKSVLIYTVHKAASMFLHKLTNDLSKHIGFNYYSINKAEYFDQIKSISWKKFIESKPKNSCFGPIRAGTAEPSIPAGLESYSIVLHLRDPRDVLVSLFYTHTYNHPRRPGRFNPSDTQLNKWKEEGIDKFVLNKASDLQGRYQYLASAFLGKKNVILLRYEDMVIDYHTWLQHFLAAFSHFAVPSNRILKFFKHRNSWADIYKKYLKKYMNDFTIPSENIYRHKRQITPGDHKQKLKEDTIKRLSDEFSDILKMLNYK
jgi:hypothetical protein